MRKIKRTTNLFKILFLTSATSIISFSGFYSLSIQKNGSILPKTNSEIIDNNDDTDMPSFVFNDTQWKDAHLEKVNYASYTFDNWFDFNIVKDSYLFQFPIYDWKNIPSDDDAWLTYREALNLNLVGGDFKLGLGNEGSIGNIGINGYFGKNNNPIYPDAKATKMDVKPYATNCSDANITENKFGSGNEWKWNSTIFLINHERHHLEVSYKINDNKSIFDILELKRTSSNTPERSSEIQVRPNQKFSFTLTASIIDDESYTGNYTWGSFYNGDDTNLSTIKTTFNTDEQSIYVINSVYLNIFNNGQMPISIKDMPYDQLSFEINSSNIKIQQFDGTYITDNQILLWFQNYNAKIENLSYEMKYGYFDKLQKPTLKISANLTHPILTVYSPTGCHGDENSNIPPDFGCWGKVYFDIAFTRSQYKYTYHLSYSFICSVQ